MEAYPLYWPEGRPRTRFPERSRFDTSQGIAQDALMNELSLLKAKDIVISTNIPLRRDGLPYAHHKVPSDQGVAVYFSRDGKQVCFACDRWDRIKDNIQAIRKTVEALRGIARWGTGDMMAAAFTGFTALPAPYAPSWRDILGLVGNVSRADAERAYRDKARSAHPDASGGSNAKMASLNAAIEIARVELQ